MRITLEPSSEPSPSPSRSQTPKEEVEWVPLPKHPLFTAHGGATTAAASRNLLAWDGASRLYFWDSNKRCLHRLSLRLGDPDPSSVLAASPSKVLPFLSLSLSLSSFLFLHLGFLSWKWNPMLIRGEFETGVAIGRGARFRCPQNLHQQERNSDTPFRFRDSLCYVPLRTRL